jgi:4-amino-4-deoxy-L-arabinose transferase-like glycosyltransferase
VSDRWASAALAAVAAVTLLRLGLLPFNRTDLFVDEAQYWLWGQTPAWGYYSKPPLIAWVVGSVTGLAGSDAAFWIRAPGAVLHAATALLLAAVTARLFGGRAASAVAAGYVTLPMAAVGSLLFTTDTLMLPLLAAGLWFWIGVLHGGGVGAAALAGACIGGAVLAKYAGLYLPLGLAAAALASPGWRAPPRCWTAMLGTAAVMTAPNLAWNLDHGLATLSHTVDNIGWIRDGARPSPGALAAFLASQLLVAGPVVVLGVLAALRAPPRRDVRALAALAAVPMAAVSVQALLGGANANWAVAAWLPGTVLAMVWLAGRPRWLVLSLAVNGAVTVALPVLTLFPDLSAGKGPLLARYLGRADLSRQIVAAAAAAGVEVVVADRRDVLADLFYTGRDSGLRFHARPQRGPPRNFYEQMHMLPHGATGRLLLVTADPGGCATGLAVFLDVARGAYDGTRLAAWPALAECLAATLPGPAGARLDHGRSGSGHAVLGGARP